MQVFLPVQIVGIQRIHPCSNDIVIQTLKTGMSVGAAIKKSGNP